MTRVLLVGSGNLAYHLCTALHAAGEVKLVQVRARDPKRLSGFAKGVPRAGLNDPLPKVDLCLMAVSDQAIEKVAPALENSGALLAHCSGAQPLQALSGTARAGVFYPLQTFTKERPVGFKKIPVFVEAGNPEDLELLRNVAGNLGATPVEADSGQRLRMHLAAVFINNFTNHMVYLGEKLGMETGLDPGLLRPLLRETIGKLEDLSPYESQTGPARRGDLATVEKHLALLGNGSGAALYQLISDSIQKTYET